MLDKKISISGFELDMSEQQKVNEVIEKYLEKINDKLGDFQEIKIRMKKSQHGKAFLHEIEGDIITKEKIITSKYTDYNLLKALAEVFEKMLVDIDRIKEKAREKNEKKI